MATNGKNEKRSQTILPEEPQSVTDPITNVHWVPFLHIPMERRLQMMAVCFWIALLGICTTVFFAFCFTPPLWPFILAYIAFIYLDKAPENGGRRFQWMRHLSLWRYFADYFPVKLIKEQELDPSKTYVFGYHPHGIISMGAFANFATEATGFSNIFPGITPSLLTLASNFHLPFYRDIILSLGMASVSRHSCESILSSGPGRAIVIVLGGASESLNARPGMNDLVLKRRLGFVKLAIRQQSPLVPVFSFGENDLYEQVENRRGSRLRRMQKKIQHALGFTLPLFHARGIFNYDVGLIPFRHQIVTIVGKPISVPKLTDGDKEPTEEQLLAVQEKYIEGLKAIYDKYKDIYAKDRKCDLRIID
ncbi:diacylglycerol acyltransferase [Radiomyces spectabilis]|uniref:diacylglycerol acyltransferase n=1 Tax=Radiomyces spectabilis TaxID=64574 RepID=UPI00221FBCE5|nr:diacylglycerol acyltransferase [Radiomyces spectabilis]KAI8388859.1 diacylglycerol acyltransferase [Radiomyces spectabilis]